MGIKIFKPLRFLALESPFLASFWW